MLFPSLWKVKKIDSIVDKLYNFDLRTSRTLHLSNGKHITTHESRVFYIGYLVTIM